MTDPIPLGRLPERDVKRLDRDAITLDKLKRARGEGRNDDRFRDRRFFRGWCAELSCVKLWGINDIDTTCEPGKKYDHPDVGEFGVKTLSTRNAAAGFSWVTGTIRYPQLLCVTDEIGSSEAYGWATPAMIHLLSFDGIKDAAIIKKGKKAFPWKHRDKLIDLMGLNWNGEKIIIPFPPVSNEFAFHGLPPVDPDLMVDDYIDDPEWDFDERG